MNAFAGFDRRVDSSNKIRQIKNDNGDKVGNVWVRYLPWSKQDRHCPVKTYTINKQQRELWNKSLGAMPANEVSSFPIAEVKYQSRCQVDDR